MESREGREGVSEQVQAHPGITNPPLTLTHSAVSITVQMGRFERIHAYTDHDGVSSAQRCLVYMAYGELTEVRDLPLRLDGMAQAARLWLHKLLL